MPNKPIEDDDGEEMVLPAFIENTFKFLEMGQRNVSFHITTEARDLTCIYCFEKCRTSLRADSSGRNVEQTACRRCLNDISDAIRKG